MEFEAWAESARDKLIAHYAEHFEIRRSVELGDLTVPLVFIMRNSQPKSYLGFSMKNAAMGPEACEIVLVMHEREFGGDTLERMRGLITLAEKEYIKPGKDHGFTFISVALLCESVDAAAAKALKKYKLRKDYPSGGGWMLARAAVTARDGASFCNRDGADFARLLKKQL